MIYQLICFLIVSSTLISTENIKDEFGFEYSEESLIKANEMIRHEEFLEQCYGSERDNEESNGELIISEPDITGLSKYYELFTKAYDFKKHKSNWSDVEIAKFILWIDGISEQLLKFRVNNNFEEPRKRVKKYCYAIMKFFQSMMAAGINSGYKSGYRKTMWNSSIGTWRRPIAFKLHKVTDLTRHLTNLKKSFQRRHKPSQTIVDALETNARYRNGDVGPAPPYINPPSYDAPTYEDSSRKENKWHKFINMKQHVAKLKQRLSKRKFKRNSRNIDAPPLYNFDSDSN